MCLQVFRKEMQTEMLTNTMMCPGVNLEIVQIHLWWAALVYANELVCVCVCFVYLFGHFTHFGHFIQLLSLYKMVFTSLQNGKPYGILQHSVELSNAQHNNHRNKRALSFVVVAAVVLCVLFSLSSFYDCIDLFLIFQQFFGVQGIASWGWCALVCSMPIVVCECVWMIQDAKICAA